MVIFVGFAWRRSEHLMFAPSRNSGREIRGTAVRKARKLEPLSQQYAAAVPGRKAQVPSIIVRVIVVVLLPDSSTRANTSSVAAQPPEQGLEAGRSCLTMAVVGAAAVDASPCASADSELAEADRGWQNGSAASSQAKAAAV